MLNMGAESKCQISVFTKPCTESKPSVCERLPISTKWTL